MTVRIDKNIPPPTAHGGTSKIRRRKWPWIELEIGDSFLITGVQDDSARGMASNAGIRYGIKLKTKPMPDGVRVWRIA